MILPEFLVAIILGLINGLTEFLPVSSTGHLIIAEKILGVSQEKFGLTFDAAVHLGTAVAVLGYFWQEWLQIIKGNKGKLGRYLLIATVPAALIGLKFEKTIETAFRQPWVVAVTLIIGGLIIYLAERIGKKKKKIGEIGGIGGFGIGLSQSLALIPGISRSGITIATGMFFGFTRKSAAEFCFLLSGPIVLGAGGKKFLDVIGSFVGGSLSNTDFEFFLVGILTAALAGWLAIRFLMKYVTGHSLNIFVVYRIILAIAILIFL